MLEKLKSIISDNDLGDFVASFTPGVTGNKTRIKQFLAGKKNSSTLEKIFLEDGGRVLVTADTEASIVPIMENALTVLAEKITAAAKATNPLGAKAKSSELQKAIYDSIEANADVKKTLFEKAYDIIANSDTVKDILTTMEKAVGESDAKDAIADALVMSACLCVMSDAATSVVAKDLSTGASVSAVVVPPAASAAHTANPNPDPAGTVEPDPSATGSKKFELVAKKVATGTEDDPDFYKNIRILIEQLGDNAAPEVVDRVGEMLQPHVKKFYNKMAEMFDSVAKDMTSKMTDRQRENVEFHQGVLLSSFPHNMKPDTVDVKPFTKVMGAVMSGVDVNDIEFKYDEVVPQYAGLSMLTHKLVEGTLGVNPATAVAFFKMLIGLGKGYEQLAGGKTETEMQDAIKSLITAMGLFQENVYEYVTSVNKMVDSGSKHGVGILVGMQMRQADQFILDGSKLLQAQAAFA